MAQALGKTVRELLSSLDSLELAEFQDRADGRSGSTTEGYAISTTGGQTDTDSHVQLKLDFDADGEPFYTYTEGGGADETVVVKITGNASGGGKYNGRILSPPSTAAATGTLAMPEGMGVPGADDALLLNPFENGLNTHSLASNSYQVGQVVGVTTVTPVGRKIVVLAGGKFSLPTGNLYDVLQVTAVGPISYAFGPVLV